VGCTDFDFFDRVSRIGGSFSALPLLDLLLDLLEDPLAGAAFRLLVVDPAGGGAFLDDLPMLKLSESVSKCRRL
jgi:hypothetical protein